MDRDRIRINRLKRTISTLMLLLFATLFILYGIWPRDGNKLVSPFATQALEASQISYVVPTNIIPLEDNESSSDVILVSPDERELLLQLVFCEGNTESLTCQMAILQVVFNRVESDKFPNTIYEVLYQDNQFTSVGTQWFNNAKHNETNELALDLVLSGNKVIPENVLYFWTTGIDVETKGSWVNKMHENNYYGLIDNTYFYYE